MELVSAMIQGRNTLMSWYNWERDAIISHGTSKFLQERLFHMSDPFHMLICDNCGTNPTNGSYCNTCNSNKIYPVNIPYASKLFMFQLSAMCIKTKYSVKM